MFCRLNMPDPVITINHVFSKYSIIYQHALKQRNEHIDNVIKI